MAHVRHRSCCFSIGMWKQHSRATAFVPPTARDSGVGPNLGIRISYVGEARHREGLTMKCGSGQPETSGSFPGLMDVWMDSTGGCGHTGSDTRRTGCGKRTRKCNLVQETLGIQRPGVSNSTQGRDFRLTSVPGGFSWPLQFSPISVPLCGSDSFRMALPSP